VRPGLLSISLVQIVNPKIMQHLKTGEMIRIGLKFANIAKLAKSIPLTESRNKSINNVLLQAKYFTAALQFD
jgi:hypothetical protein